MWITPVCRPLENHRLQILLSEIGGARELIAKPVFTISDRFKFAEGQSKRVRTAGFEPTVMSTTGGADDQFIIGRIRELDPKKVAEIVLVAADRDYTPELSEKAAQGIKVFWVAVRGSNRSGNPMISPDLEEIFENGKFHFVDLAQFKDRIMNTPWRFEHRSDGNGSEDTPAPPAIPDTKTIKVTFVMTVAPDRTHEILHSVGSLMGNVSKLKGVINSTMTTEF